MLHCCVHKNLCYISSYGNSSLLKCHARIEGIFLESGCCRLSRPVGIRVTDLKGRTCLFSWSWQCREASGTENKYALTEIIVIGLTKWGMTEVEQCSIISEAWKSDNGHWSLHKVLYPDEKIFKMFIYDVWGWEFAPKAETIAKRFKLKKLINKKSWNKNGDEKYIPFQDKRKKNILRRENTHTYKQVQHEKSTIFSLVRIFLTKYWYGRKRSCFC